MSDAEQQVRAVYPQACVTSRPRYKRNGEKWIVFEILPHPFAGKANRPISTACLTPDAAWRSAAAKLTKPQPAPETNQRERRL